MFSWLSSEKSGHVSSEDPFIPVEETGLYFLQCFLHPDILQHTIAEACCLEGYQDDIFSPFLKLSANLFMSASLTSYLLRDMKKKSCLSERYSSVS